MAKKKKKARFTAEKPTAEVVRCVLLYLSPKIVTRFRLVSKEWNSIITDSTFIRSYVNNKTIDSRRAHGVVLGMNPLFFVEEQISSPLMAKVTVDFDETLGFVEHTLIGIADGLMCIRVKRAREVLAYNGNPVYQFLYFLFNPISDKDRHDLRLRTIPRPKKHGKLFYTGGPAPKQSSYGFGYDMTSDDYVIALFRLMPSDRFALLEVFWFGHHKFQAHWIETEVKYRELLDEFFREAVFANMSFHSIIDKPGRRSLLSFDLTTRTFNEYLSLPDPAATALRMSVLDGLLLIVSQHPKHYNIWMLKDTIWVLKTMLGRGRIDRCLATDIFPTPLGFSTEGWTQIATPKRILRCSVKTGEIMSHIPPTDDDFIPKGYIASLLKSNRVPAVDFPATYQQ